MIQIVRGITGRSMSMVWAINDYRPADGGLPLIHRYAARVGLSEAERAIARGLADARLDAYRVRPTAAGAWLELESLGHGTSVGVAWRDAHEQLDLGEVLVARVVRATSLPTLCGLGPRFPGGERRWRARLALTAGRAEGGLTQLRAEVNRGLRTRRFGGYEESGTWARAARPTLTELQTAVDNAPSGELVELLQGRSVTSSK
jgi:hypothetical protein